MRLFEVYQHLVEAQNYEQMFQSVLDAYESLPFELSDNVTSFFGGGQSVQNVKSELKKEIDTVRKTYKRQDRIIWRLRAFKYLLLIVLENAIAEEIDRELPPEQRQIAINIMKSLESQMKSISKRFPYVADVHIDRLFPTDNSGIDRTVGHFLSLGYQPIEDYQWKDQQTFDIINDLEDLEDKWKEQRKRTLEIQEDDQEILKVNNKQSWWLLDREYCQREGDAMGHCGNAPSRRSGDRVLSFRTRISETEVMPHLTFILHREGLLGEMKGRGNDKPSPKYHPAIVQLLVKRQDLIKGIRGGGYMSENNFKLRDLEDKELQKKLLEMNPKLGTLGDVLSLYGWHSDESRKIVIDLLQESGMEYHEDSTEFILEERNRLSDILDYLGNDLAVKVAESIQGDDDIYLDFYYGYDLDQQEAELEFEEFFESNPEEKQRLVDYLKREHDYDEEQDLFDFIYEEGIDDVKDAFDRAYSEGSASGAEAKMYEDFENVVKSLPYFGYEGDRIFGADSYYKVIGIHEIMDVLADYPEIVDYVESPDHPYDSGGDYIQERVEEYVNEAMTEELREFREPQYGWEGFDKEMAFDRLKDELYDLTYEKSE